MTNNNIPFDVERPPCDKIGANTAIHLISVDSLPNQRTVVKTAGLLSALKSQTKRLSLHGLAKCLSMGFTCGRVCAPRCTHSAESPEIARSRFLFAVTLERERERREPGRGQKGAPQRRYVFILIEHFYFFSSFLSFSLFLFHHWHPSSRRPRSFSRFENCESIVSRLVLLRHTSRIACFPILLEQITSQTAPSAIVGFLLFVRARRERSSQGRPHEYPSTHSMEIRESREYRYSKNLYTYEFISYLPTEKMARQFLF